MLHDRHHAGLTMNSFQLVLHDSTHASVIDGVTSFVAEDESGSFGIKAGHARIMAALVFGLAQFTTGGDHWQYIALPGAILYFSDNVLTVNTRRFLVSDDYDRIREALLQTLAKEEEQLAAMKRNLRNIESQIMRRLMEAQKEP